MKNLKATVFSAFLFGLLAAPALSQQIDIKQIKGANAAGGFAALDGSGRIPASIFPGLSGDLTNTPGSLVIAVANGAITPAKMSAATANNFLAGPVSGSSGPPTYRGMVSADLPGPVYITPTSAADFNAKIAAAISAGATSVKVTPGTYDFTKSATDNFGNPTMLLINGAGNLKVDFQGSALELVATDVPDYAAFLTAQNSIHGTLLEMQNAVFRMKTPSYSRAFLTATSPCVSNANGTATFLAYGGVVPSWSSVKTIITVSNDGFWSGGFYADDIAAGMPLTNIGGGSYTLSFNGATQCSALALMGSAIGQNFVNESIKFSWNGVNLYNVANITFSNVRLANAPGNGYNFLGANDILFTNHSGIYPDLPLSEAWLTTTGAGISVSAASGKVVFDPTTVSRGTGDDSLFIGPYITPIISVASRTNLTVSATYPYLPVVKVGDELQFIDPNGAVQGRAFVTAATVSGGNAAITLFGTGAPAGVDATWKISNASNTPKLCDVDGGYYGGSPTRGIIISCHVNKIHGVRSADTQAAGIAVEYGRIYNTGYVSEETYIYDNVLSFNNYASGAYPAAITVWGFGNSLVTPPAGQFGVVSIHGNSCYGSGEGCIYVGSANVFQSSSNHNLSWYTLGTSAGYQNVCGPLGAYGISFCNVSDAQLSGDVFSNYTNNVGYAGTNGIINTATPYRWSIGSSPGSLPPCVSTNLGMPAVVNNGITSPTYHQAVTTATGTAWWGVQCAYNGSANGWVY